MKDISASITTKLYKLKNRRGEKQTEEYRLNVEYASAHHGMWVRKYIINNEDTISVPPKFRAHGLVCLYMEGVLKVWMS